MGEPVLGDGLDAVLPTKDSDAVVLLQVFDEDFFCGSSSLLVKEEQLMVIRTAELLPVFCFYGIYPIKVGSCEYGLLSRNPYR